MSCFENTWSVVQLIERFDIYKQFIHFHCTSTWVQLWIKKALNNEGLVLAGIEKFISWLNTTLKYSLILRNHDQLIWLDEPIWILINISHGIQEAHWSFTLRRRRRLHHSLRYRTNIHMSIHRHVQIWSNLYGTLRTHIDIANSKNGIINARHIKETVGHGDISSHLKQKVRCTLWTRVEKRICQLYIVGIYKLWTVWKRYCRGVS